MNSNVKIFVTYKDRHKLIKSEVFCPIQTGRAISNDQFKEMIGDDTGDNISSLNDWFCEMSAIYWCWKNYDKIGNPKYIGFMHYRRHFIFGNGKYNCDYYGLEKFSEINDDYYRNQITSDKNIINIVNKYDCLFPRQVDISEYTSVKNNYDQYKKYHNIKDYDILIDLIKNCYPEYYEILCEYNESNLAFFLNMFILKKEDFFEYCKWIFDVLFIFKTRIKIDSLNTYNKRTIGFISERLTALYLLKLKKKYSNYCFLPISYVENTNYSVDDIKVKIKNIKSIPIVLSSSNEYVPYLSVCLKSIFNEVSLNNDYCIYILERDITKLNKDIILRFFSKENVDIEFINVKFLEQEISKLNILSHISIDSYLRFYIPKIFSDYNKVLYIDSDTLVCDDPAKLFSTNIDGFYLGATKDAIMNSFYYFDKKKMKDYFKKTLCISSPLEYFQSGVLLLNINLINANFTPNDFINVAFNNKLLYMDQCVFNICFNGRVKYIDLSWNCEIEHKFAKDNNLMLYLNLDFLNDYRFAHSSPNIIHFAGDRKPWNYPDEDFAYLWWNIARNTPYYELILSRMSQRDAHNIVYNSLKSVFNLKNYFFMRLRYVKYKILSMITLNNIRNHYIVKRTKYKNIIKHMKYVKKIYKC